ncbi:hypothetical protein Godav_028409 [Gossypium davidsonii]|uniref:RNase H type-1 domain-containing protein n=1 Tax=Gossypium davidsonii TaxID=34287 RepID=A0A7J8RZB8_GOSDV|nr:hypothetical protein [Gossypium davidsonii]
MGSGITLHSNILDAGLAEAIACYQGLLFAKEMGFIKVEVEGDAWVVIEKINQEENGRADLDSIIADIKAFEREGYSRSENTFWMEDIPAVAKELVVTEETSNVLGVWTGLMNSLTAML